MDSQIYLNVLAGLGTWSILVYFATAYTRSVDAKRINREIAEWEAKIAALREAETASVKPVKGTVASPKRTRKPKA